MANWQGHHGNSYRKVSCLQCGRMLSFKPTFSLSSFTFIKRLFSSSLLSTIRVVSSVYLRLLVFLPAILIPASVSSSPVFLMMYSAYKLNKQGDNIQPWRTPFPIWNQSVFPCPVLTIASWPAYLSKGISMIFFVQFFCVFLPPDLPLEKPIFRSGSNS